MVRQSASIGANATILPGVTIGRSAMVGAGAVVTRTVPPNAIVVDDGKARQEFELSNPQTGLYIPPMVWAIQYKYSAHAVLLVFASDPYDSADYIRDYDAFLEAIGRTPTATADRMPPPPLHPDAPAEQPARRGLSTSVAGRRRHAHS